MWIFQTHDDGSPVFDLLCATSQADGPPAGSSERSENPGLAHFNERCKCNSWYIFRNDWQGTIAVKCHFPFASMIGFRALFFSFLEWFPREFSTTFAFAWLERDGVFREKGKPVPKYVGQRYVWHPTDMSAYQIQWKPTEVAVGPK